MNQKAKKVCVITGGSSGIGFSSAKRMGKKGYFLVPGTRTPSKLDKALTELTNCGIKAATCPCDISDWTSVQNLAKFAAQSWHRYYRPAYRGYESTYGRSRKNHGR